MVARLESVAEAVGTCGLIIVTAILFTEPRRTRAGEPTRASAEVLADAALGQPSPMASGGHASAPERPTTKEEAAEAFAAVQEGRDRPYYNGPWKTEWETCSRENGEEILAEAKRLVGPDWERHNELLLACCDDDESSVGEGPSWTILTHDRRRMCDVSTEFYDCDPYTGISVTPDHWYDQDQNLSWPDWRDRKDCFSPP